MKAQIYQIDKILSPRNGKNGSFRASRLSKIDFTLKSWNFHTVIKGEASKNYVKLCEGEKSRIKVIPICNNEMEKIYSLPHLMPELKGKLKV